MHPIEEPIYENFMKTRKMVESFRYISVYCRIISNKIKEMFF